jgi:cytoskeletal protein RodZ
MQPSVGEQLRSTREARKASIDEASKATHIRPFFIEALEDGRYSDIPSNAQIKGFIRLYADWLNLSSKPLLDIFDGKIDEIATPILEIASQILPEKSLPSQAVEETVTEELDTQVTPPLIPETQTTESDSPDTNIVLDLENSTEGVVTSQSLFLEIGQQLQSCRTRLGIGIEDIEKLTHIRSRYLIAMEAGQFNDIPSLVQARGLLSGYATFLNLDTDNLVGIFADALQKRRIEMLPPEPEKKQSAKKIARPVSEQSGIRRFFTVDLVLGSVVIVGLVGFGIWAAAQVISSGDLEIVSTAPPISDVLLNNPTVAPVTQLTTTAGPTELARNPDLIGQIPTAGTSDESALTDGSATPAVPSLGDSAMQVYIVPNQRVFLQVTVGNKVAFSGRTTPGNAYPFTGEDRIEVVSGNAAALQIYYNQRDLGTLGLPGETLRIIFSKEGITTPTPAKTAAPSSTPLPTLTLFPTATQIPPTVTPLIP